MKHLFLLYLTWCGLLGGCAAVESAMDHKYHHHEWHWDPPPIDKPKHAPLSFTGVHPVPLDQPVLDNWLKINGLLGIIDTTIKIRHGHYEHFVVTSVILTNAKENIKPENVQWLLTDRSYTADNSETACIETKDGWIFFVFHTTDTWVRM